MQRSELNKKLFSILATDFSIDLDKIDPGRSIFEQVPVDSMQLVAIAAKIEQEFGIELPLTIMENPTLDNLIAQIEGATFTPPKSPKG